MKRSVCSKGSSVRHRVRSTDAYTQYTQYLSIRSVLTRFVTQFVIIKLCNLFLRAGYITLIIIRSSINSFFFVLISSILAQSAVSSLVK